MYLMHSVFLKYLSLVYDYIHRLDSTVYFLLATGYPCFGLISHCMAHPAAFQDSGDCCRRCVWAFESDYHVTCQGDTADIKCRLQR